MPGIVITPESLAKSGTEHGHQCALFQHIAVNETDPRMKLLFAVPNGGDRRPSVAASLKAEGVKPGVPDLFLPVALRYDDEQGWCVTRYHGLWIEMKRPALAKGERRETVKLENGEEVEIIRYGGCSEVQDKWHRLLRLQHYAVVVCYSWEDAVWALRLYLANQLSMPSDEHPMYCYGAKV